MIARGDVLLVIESEREGRVRLRIDELDSLMAALELLRSSQAKGLNVARVDCRTFVVSTWTAGA